MDKKLIEKINKAARKLSAEQGIYLQPNGVPIKYKEPVIYSRYNSFSMEGGSCWGGTPEAVTHDRPEDHMEILNIVLRTLAPKITYLDFLELKKLIKNNTDRQPEYYGNSEEYFVEYLPMSTLEKFLKDKGY